MKSYTKCIICNEDKDERLTYDDLSMLPHHDSCIANATGPQRDKAVALINERKKELAKEYFQSPEDIKKILSEEVQGSKEYAYNDAELSRLVHESSIKGSRNYSFDTETTSPTPFGEQFPHHTREQINMMIQGDATANDIAIRNSTNLNQSDFVISLNNNNKDQNNELTLTELKRRNNHTNAMRQGSQVPEGFGNPLYGLPSEIADKLDVTVVGDEYQIRVRTLDSGEDKKHLHHTRPTGKRLAVEGLTGEQLKQKISEDIDEV